MLQPTIERSSMKKLVLLAVVAATTALFALPAAASAAEWEMDPAGWAFNSTAVGNTVLKTNNNETVTCTGSTGSGAYNAGSKTEGTLQLKFTTCTESVFGGKCSTAGQPEGTITTTAALIFKNAYLEDNKLKPGITIRGTGAEEHFVSFECAGGLFKAKVTGTVLGETEGACNLESEEQKVNFVATSHGVQKWNQDTKTGAIEDLTTAVTVFGGTTNRTSSQDGTGILKSKVAGEKAKITCV
jgi:hypothetical protein